MPGRLGWIALGVGAYAAFVLIMFPATTAYRWLAPDDVVLSGVDGTVWSGRAALGSLGPLPLRDLRWQLQPSALIGGRIAARLEARLADGFVDGRVSARPGLVELTDLRGATMLAALGTILPVDAINGQVALTVDQLVLRDGWPVSAAGDVRLERLEVAPLFAAQNAPPIALGSFLLRFTPTAGDVVHAEIADSDGPLEVTGELVLSPDRAYRIEGLVRPRDEASTDLVQGLAFMTEDPDEGGRRRFSFTGTL